MGSKKKGGDFVKFVRSKKNKTKMQKKEMQDYLIVEEEKLSLLERLLESWKIRLDSKKMKKTLVMISSFVIIALILCSIPMLVSLPFKGQFAYVDGVGVYNDVKKVYQGKIKDDKMTIPFIKDTPIQISLGNATKLRQYEEKQWEERDVFEVHLHIPWQGEAIAVTGVYQADAILSRNEEGSLHFKKAVKSLYPEEFLSQILSYTNIFLSAGVEQTGQKPITIRNRNNLSEIEVKEQEAVLTYQIEVSVPLEKQEAISQTEKVIIELTDYIKGITEDCQTEIVWQEQTTTNNIQQLGESLLLDKHLIFYKKTKQNNPLSSCYQLELQAIPTKIKSNKIFWGQYKHNVRTDNLKSTSYYFEKDKKQIEEEYEIAYKNMSLNSMNVYYTAKENEADYFVIPYVFEEEETKQEQIVTLPVPNEDGSFTGDYQFEIKGSNQKTNVKIKKAYWNKTEWRIMGESLCYELEIEDENAKKQLDNIQIKTRGIEDIHASGGSIYRGIIWKGETPYLVIFYMTPEHLIGKKEWQIQITNMTYRYTQPLKIPLKSR